MATAKQTRNTRKTAGRRTGRPTNAERALRQQSETVKLINVAAASYATGMAAALGVDPSAVQTIASVAQPAQSQPASAATTSQAQPASRRGSTAGRKTPGRKVQPDSKMSLTRRFYDENMALPEDQRLDRASLVKAAAKKFKYTPQTANTYISNIEREGGRKLVRRSTGAGAARGRSRANSNGNGQKTGTNA